MLERSSEHSFNMSPLLPSGKNRQKNSLKEWFLLIRHSIELSN